MRSQKTVVFQPGVSCVDVTVVDACETGRRSTRLVSFACGRVGCGGSAWFALHRASILRRRRTRIAGTISVSPPVAFADFADADAASRPLEHQCSHPLFRSWRLHFEASPLRIGVAFPLTTYDQEVYNLSVLHGSPRRDQAARYVVFSRHHLARPDAAGKGSTGTSTHRAKRAFARLEEVRLVPNLPIIR